MIAAVYRDAHPALRDLSGGLEDRHGAGHAQWRGISAEARFAARARGAMGALLDVPEDIVRQLKAVYDEEQAVREKRIKLAFPDGPPAV